MADLTGALQAAAGTAASAGGAADPNFNQTVLLLHGDGTNGAQNNTFLDSSTNNFTITRNGNTSQGTFSPFSGPDGYWSNFFDGTNDRLTIADNAALRPGTSAFTIEAWVYRAAAGAAHTIFAKGASTPTGFAFLITSSDTLRFTDTSTDITSTGTVAANTWVHVAAVREGTGSNQLKLYINGVQDGTGTSSTDFTQTEEARIGENRGATDDFNGYISNFRYVIGTALYTSGFTPSTSPLTTTSQGATSSQVELLTCQSNRFLDNSTNGFTISPVNNTSVQPFSPFAPSAAYDASVNGGSGYFDGSGDYLTTPTDADFAFGTGDFTVECWCYLTSTSSYRYLFDFREGSGATSNIYAYFDTGTTTVRIGVGATDDSSSGSVSLNTWSHIALVRSGTTVTVYINGSSTNSFTSSQNLSTSTAVFIGSRYTNQQYMIGYVASFRAVKGTAVYTSAFTPPTAPLTAIANTSLLLNFTNAGIFDNTGKNNLETVGNAQIDTTTKKYGTGSMEFDGTGDWLIGPVSSLFNFGTGDFTVEMWIYATSVGGGTERFLLDTRATGSDTGLAIYLSTTGVLSVNSDNAVRATAGTVSANTWTFITVTRSSGSLRAYVGGTSGTAATYTAAITALGNIRIGIKTDNTTPFVGFIDDIRITKGVARYNATFTPPTAAFPNL